MTNNKSILEKLRENNPFASSSSPLPWDNMNPDLVQLNRLASEEIEQLIRHKRREPSVPLAGLILGEIGAGKTHMLTRILRKLRENETPAIFVIVRMFRDTESVTQHLLSEVFISLKHIHSSGRSQFDVIAEEVMNAYEERRRIDGFDDISRIDKRVYLSRDMPSLDRNFLKCLLLYVKSNDASEKLEILEWLEYGLDDEDSARLGLPEKNIDMMSDAKRESIAEKTLISLGLLLAYAKIPMIICFDQLEQLKTRELIDAWENLISLIVNDLHGILPLCFLKPETWNSTFMPVLDSSVVQRLTNNTIIMNTCTAEQARLLIHDRITHVFKEGAEEIYQWLIGKMHNSIRPNMSPRRIIKQANQIIMSTDTGDDEKAIYKTVSDTYYEERQKVQSEPDEWPPNTDNLTLALDVWLNSHDEFEAVKGTGKYIKIMGDYNGKRFAFVICARKHNAVAKAAFKRGCDFFREYPEGQCFYITEDKTNKSTWNKVKELRDTFESSGGHVIMLNKDTRINWYALTALINRTDNGDVNLYLTSGSRSASRDEIMKFIRTIELIPGMFSGKTEHEDTTHEVNREVPNETQKPEEINKPAIEADMLSMNLNSIIKSSPMNLISISRAIEALLRREIIISREELILFLKNNTGTFRTYASVNDTLIALNDKN